jgi:hypothetical protein
MSQLMDAKLQIQESQQNLEQVRGTQNVKAPPLAA